jgi:hypothetical protein
MFLRELQKSMAQTARSFSSRPKVS